MTERALDHARRAESVPGDDSGFAATVQHPLGEDSQPPDSQPAEVSLPFPDSTPALDLGPADAAQANDAEPTIGHVGRYALKRLIGEGGLGTVYAAWDPILARAVAVKTLNLEAAGIERQDLDNLFAHEARAVAGLNHPHIVTVFDAGVDPQRGAYLAMEQLVGQDLRQLLAAGWKPSASQAARLVRRLADALTYAHGMGVFHCDIKPANVFMVERRRPKILDFGIARLAREHARPALPGAPELPSAGSPQYAAPEQLRGGRTDARTDVHALGLLLYELLAGRRAFEGRTLADVEAAVLGPRPAPAHQAQPDVPGDLARIAERAMALDPGERFPSARDMARALRRWGDEHAAARPLPAAQPAAPNAARPATPADRTAARPRRLAALAALLGIALVGLVAWIWQVRASTDVAAAAVRPTTPAPMPTAAKATEPAAPAAGVAAAAAGTATAEPERSAAPPGDAGLSGESTGPASNATGATKPPSGSATAVIPPRVATNSPAALALRTRAPKPPEPDARAEAQQPPPPAAPPATGTLRFAVTPWGQIEVNGKAAGTTPPLTSLNLPTGEHQVTIRNGDFAPHTVTVRVEAEQPVQIRHRFGS